ncbi:bifunctional AP-4-A phosphorylase/ADP sulfurylase [Tilletia horrida]|nr:bifunctional AP-4-A phosphorylase/ADP sulfurylase [Tilletia horrida]
MTDQGGGGSSSSQGSTSAVHNIADLQKRVSKQFDEAIKAGDAYFYESSRVVVPSSSPEIDFVVTCVPALAQKAKESAAANQKKEGNEERKRDEGEEKPKDVFAPPYIPNLLVKELDDFTVLLNKFAVLPRHFLLVTRNFVSQELPPSPRMLALAYRIILSYPSSSSSELMAFYNCGAQSGASQPHQHIQFIAVSRKVQQQDGKQEEDEEEEEEDDVDDLDARPNIPIEVLLNRIERDGKEDEAVHALPVPWQHFVRLIKPPKVPTSSKDPQQHQARLQALEGYMASRLVSLIDTQFQSRRVEAQSSSGESRSGRPSFNLLLSKRAFHLIPRRESDITIPMEGSETSTTDISVNSLGYAGLLLARSEEEVEAVKQVEGGILGILAKAGREPVSEDSWQAP